MNCNVPEKRLMEYMKYIEKGEYEQMYAMLDQKKSSMNSKEEFIERNSKIYEGIEMSDLSITDITVKRQENGNAAVSYTTNMQTAAGNVEFTNDAVFSHDWTGYHLIWQDQLIFPELSATDKVQVTSEEAKRGDILIFKYLGFKDYEYVVSRAISNLTVSLNSDSEELDEIVVTGISEEKRVNSVSAVSSLDLSLIHI